jgi:hypothetical protein
LTVSNHDKEASAVNRPRNVAVGAAVLLVGVVGLFLPVSVWDGNTSTISCGNALVANQSAPRAADSTTVADAPIPNQVIPHRDYATECESAISGRRHWAIPLVIVGAVGLLVGLFVRGRRVVAPDAGDTDEPRNRAVQIAEVTVPSRRSR